MRNMKVLISTIFTIIMLAISACGNDTRLQGEFISENGMSGGLFNFTGDDFTFTIPNSEIDPTLREGDFVINGTFFVNNSARVIEFSVDEEALVSRIIDLARNVFENDPSVADDRMMMGLVQFLFDEVIGGNATEQDAIDFLIALTMQLLIEEMPDADEDSLAFFQMIAEEVAQDIAPEMIDAIETLEYELRNEMMEEFAHLRLSFERGFGRLYDDEGYTFVRR